MNTFRLFHERSDIFGFDSIKSKDNDGKIEDKDEYPLKSFNVQWMMDSLSRKKINGRIKKTDAFLDHVAWGERDGAIRVRLTPNINVLIERRTTDLEGATTWVLKRLLRPKLTEYAGREEVVANDIFEHVEEIYQEGIDSASEQYQNLLHLAKRMTDKIRGSAPLLYDYQDIKQVNKDYYIIYFSIRNAGIGKLVSRTSGGGRLSPEVTIDVHYNTKRGLIHVIVSTVTYGSEGQGWEVDLPYLDSWFAPSQNKDEIISTVVNGIRFY